ncbi:MAG: RHS repeat-associated core domain-containing protein [Candidatus Thiodiazotropha sp.]|jgi:RHS repeat-associated protein
MKNTGKGIAAFTALTLSLTFALAEFAQADRTTSYAYNAMGQVETIDGPRVDVSDITTYGYDDNGNHTSITNALEQVTLVTEHDAAGRPQTIVDPNGLTTSLQYDPRGRLTQQSLSDGTTTRTTIYSYDPAGNLTRVTRPDDSFISYDYDPAHRLVGIEDSQGNRIDYKLDAMGNRLSEEVSDPNGTLTRKQRQIYDELGQVHELFDSNDNKTEYDYDANGNLTQTIDANLNLSKQAYDALDRLDEKTDALDGLTEYAYDAQDNLTSVIDPNGLVTTYQYDGLGNLTSQTSPDTGTTTYTYDEAGNRLSQTDAREITVNYHYDELNRLTQVSYPDSSLDVIYTYDQGAYGIGRLSGISDANGTTSYTYNAYGDLLSQTCTSSDDIVTTFSYAYDSHGRLASLTYPSGNSVHYSYDANGQLTGLTLEKRDGTTLPLVSNLQSLPFGPLQSFDYGNGLSLSRSFDQDYRLVAQTIPGILESSYAHDPVGNLSDWQDLLDTGRDQQFDYDDLDRLTEALGSYGSLGYDYDATGNRLSMSENDSTETYSYETGSHRLEQILGSVTDERLYDETGNTIQSLIGEYIYDDSNRLVGFSNDETTASYAYNGKGERISKTVNGITTRFRYGASGELLGEYGQDGQAIREYVYLAGQSLALVQPSNEPGPIDFDRTDILSYGGANQDISGTADAQENTLTLTGNTWKKIAFSYTVTPDTVLELDFESSAEGEIHGIGFDTNNNISPAWSFNLYGTQNWAIRDVGRYTGSGQMHLVIPVGQYFTGTMEWLTFINDHDVDNPTAESRFSNVRVYEAPDTLDQVVYLHTDHLGAVVKATDSDQNLVWDAVRKPFGERTVTVGQVEMPLGFPGQYYDEETNNYYNYFRDYDPAAGRYLQSDPIGLEGGLNTYAYVGGNPVRFIDFLGHAYSPGGEHGVPMGSMGQSSASAFSSAASMATNWALGTGPGHMTFGPNSSHIGNLKNLPAVQGAIELYKQKNSNVLNNGCECGELQPVTNYGSPFGASGYTQAWLDMNPTWHFVGSFTIAVYPVSCSEVMVVVTNTSSFTSFAYGMAPNWERSSFGPMGNMRQTYWWTQPI